MDPQLMFVLCAIVGMIILLAVSVLGLAWCCRKREQELSAIVNVVNNHRHAVYADGSQVVIPTSWRHEWPHVRAAPSQRDAWAPPPPSFEVEPVSPFAGTVASDREPQPQADVDPSERITVACASTKVSARGE